MRLKALAEIHTMHVSRIPRTPLHCSKITLFAKRMLEFYETFANFFLEISLFCWDVISLATQFRQICFNFSRPRVVSLESAFHEYFPPI